MRDPGGLGRRPGEYSLGPRPPRVRLYLDKRTIPPAADCVAAVPAGSM